MLQTLVTHIVIASLILLWSSTSTAGSCQCEELSCSPCEMKVDLEFYTEKCDGNRVKSCSRPLCAPLNPLPNECRSQRDLASAPAKKDVAPAEKGPVRAPVGTVLMSSGDVHVTRDGVTNTLKISQRVFNGDEVAASESGKAKIIFTDDSTMTLLPKTKTRLHHEFGKDTKNIATVVNLFYGTVRSVVTKGDQKKYKVETPSAVAGVRGTDFLTTYYETSQITKVQTIEGKVELASRSGGTKTLIPAGHYASFVIDTDRENSSTSMKYVDSGFITPLGTISEDQLKEIDKKFQFDSAREVASTEPEAQPICSKPTAMFNQCSYECVNNPKKSTHCRTDLQQVKCLRKRCNANGVWAEDTRLPSSEYEKCPPSGIMVDRCDY